MNKEQLYNLAISNLSNKKISNTQKSTVRQLVDAGLICEPKYIHLPQAGNDMGEALGTPKEKPADNQTGLGWRALSIIALLAFLGSLSAEIVSLYW